MSTWIALETKLGKHPKMALLPSDAARYGWVMVLCEAKEQRQPGTFASATHFRLVMDRHGKFLADYIKAKLLDEGKDGTLHVHDWQRHQWAAAKGKENPEKNGGNPEENDEKKIGPKQDASRAVPVPVSVGSSSTEGVQGEPSEIFAAIARAGAFMRPDSGLGIRLHQLIDRRGFDVVMAEVVRVIASGSKLSDRQWVFGLERALEAIPEPDAQAPIEDAARKRSQKIAEQMHARRMELFRHTGQWDPAWGERPAA